MLGYGTPSLDDFAGLDILPERPEDGGVIEALMLKKAGIFRRNKGLEDESGDFLNGNDDAFFHKKFPNELPRIGIDSADYRGVVIPEGVDPGEIMGEIDIDPPGSEAQHDEKDRQGSKNDLDIPSLGQPSLTQSHIYNVREKESPVNIKTGSSFLSL